jgi:uncharacterized cupredoxin-like copper-binding protein
VLGAAAVAAAPAALTAQAARAAAAPARVVTITARDYAFEVPDTVVAGRTELRLANQGPDLHHAWLVRLDRSHTAAEFFAAVRKGGAAPSWAQQVGGPNSPAAGGTSSAVVDLQPGNYLVLCGVPADNGQAHLRLGMMRPFTVVPAGSAAAARAVARAGGAAGAVRATAAVGDPAARGAAAGVRSTVGAPDVTLTLTDRGFALSRPLTAGRHVVRVRNQGVQVHEVLVAKLAPGATAAQALAWYETKQGPSPMTAAGGAVGLARGEYNDIVLDLAPGEYALLCRQPDVREDRAFAATHRMVEQVSVK